MLKTEEEWKEILNLSQYNVCRLGQTELPFSGEWLDYKGEEDFCCLCCGQMLFKASSKFDSKTGWPSFWQAEKKAIIETSDFSHGMDRIEIKCSACDSHLGHLFKDGPKPSGLRYCINSLALKLRSHNLIDD